MRQNPETIYIRLQTTLQTFVRYWGWKYKKNFQISKIIPKSGIFKGWHLANGSSESNNPKHFLKELNKIFKQDQIFYSPYDHRGAKTRFWRSLFIIFSYILFWKFIMVLTRPQVDNLLREELIKELLKFSDITDKLNGLNSRFEDFIKKYNELNSELLILKNCNSLLLKQITSLECNALNNAQYFCKETIEINPIPQSLPNTALENKVCKALSLNGTKVTHDDLQASHRMKNKDKVVVKFKDRKQRNKVIFQSQGTKIKRRATTKFIIWSITFHK